MSALLPIRIKYRPLLTSGHLAILPDHFLIQIDSEQPPKEQRIAFWHELIHAVRYVEGGSQDEDDVEGLAKLFAAVEEIHNRGYEQRNADALQVEWRALLGRVRENNEAQKAIIDNYLPK